MEKIEIRKPKMSDLKALLEMINSLVDERAMLTIQKRQTYKQEKEYLEKIMEEKDSLHLFLTINGKVVGSARIDKGKGVKNHVGELGISLRKEARGRGLGERLFKEIIKKATKKFKLKIISLDVYAKNKIAHNLYKKMGFQKIGIVKGGVKYYGKYEDVVLMVKYIK